MANDQSKELAHTSAQTPELRQLERRPNESEQAHAARMAFCRLPPGQRSIAGAYRSVKRLAPDERVKVPGHFSKWAKEHCWKEYAAAFDAADLGLTADLQTAQITAAGQERIKQAEELAAIQTTAIEQARQLQALIAREIEELQTPPKASGPLTWLARLLPGRRRRSAQLAELAAAAKDASLVSISAQSGLPPALPPPDREGSALDEQSAGASGS